MKITFLGQAGLFIETRFGSILCDPWFNPAYFASWFPFPNNDHVDKEKLARPTYLFISHLHYDHFDSQFLQQYVWKDAQVLLPDSPVNALESALRKIGFTKFIKPKNSRVIDVDGLRFVIVSIVAPNDGAIGDSGLLIDDGEVRIFDQNDSRPLDLEPLHRFGTFDAHFLQFSGANWYPMVYHFPEKMLQALGRKKRENEMARALRYAQEVNASFIIPSSGPPCFLDDHLFGFNDFDNDPANVFPDQMTFLDYLQAHGIDNGRLMIPGSVATFSKGQYMLAHPFSNERVQAIFTQKRTYLEAYKASKQPMINVLKASWPRKCVDILVSLKEWFEPLLQQANLICAGVNGLVLLDCVEQAIIIDFRQRRVYAWNSEEWDYYFRIELGLVEACIISHEEDWVTSLFLSCRFEAQRKGAYNEYLYSFFSSLSPERIQYMEHSYKETTPIDLFWESDGYRIQKYCPHMKGDLTRFSQIENGVLTCRLHGWQFDLETGLCFTSPQHHIYAEPVIKEEKLLATSKETEYAVESEKPLVVNDKQMQLKKSCKDCLYIPSGQRGFKNR